MHHSNLLSIVNDEGKDEKNIKYRVHTLSLNVYPCHLSRRHFNKFLLLSFSNTRI
jgi:hypothetical protein